MFARYGYIGGRVHCMAGCTSLWLLKRQDGVDVVPPTNKQRQLVALRCVDCSKRFMSKSTNGKRCEACRAAVHRKRARMAQRRYSRRIA
jgi:hypothetical protein